MIIEDTQYRSASDGVGAECSVPCITGVAVGVTVDIVKPTPVGVEHDGGLLSDTSSAGGALLRSKLGVGLGRSCAGLLTVRYGGKGECEECGSAEHGTVQCI